MVAGANTFRTTGTAIGLPPAPVEVMVTVPMYCPTGSVVPFTATCTLAGVVPDTGTVLSQPLPLWVVAATVKFKGAGLPVTAIVCAAGTAPPASWANVNVVVGAEIGPGSTLQCTLMVAGLFPAPGGGMTMLPV